MRAEKLSPDRDLARNSSGVDFGASSQKKNFFFIINPTGTIFPLLLFSSVFLIRIIYNGDDLLSWVVSGASGKTGQEWKKIEPYLKLQLSRNCNVSVLVLLLIFLFFCNVMC